MFKTENPISLQERVSDQKFQFKSFKESIIRNKNQNTLNFNNLNIVVEGNTNNYEPLVTSFKNLSSSNHNKQLKTSIVRSKTNEERQSYTSPHKYSKRKFKKEDNNDLTFKKKYQKGLKVRHTKERSGFVKTSEQSPFILYKNKDGQTPMFFKSDSFKRNKSSDLQQIESIQNLKYKVTNLMCKKVNVLVERDFMKQTIQKNCFEIQDLRNQIKQKDRQFKTFESKRSGQG